jgi:hypothetical protein
MHCGSPRISRLVLSVTRSFSQHCVAHYVNRQTSTTTNTSHCNIIKILSLTSHARLSLVQCMRLCQVLIWRLVLSVIQPIICALCSNRFHQHQLFLQQQYQATPINTTFPLTSCSVRNIGTIHLSACSDTALWTIRYCLVSTILPSSCLPTATSLLSSPSQNPVCLCSVR